MLKYSYTIDNKQPKQGVLTMTTATIFQNGKAMRNVKSKTKEGAIKGAKNWIRHLSGVSDVRMNKAAQIEAMKPFTFKVNKEGEATPEVRKHKKNSTPIVSKEDRQKTIAALNSVFSQFSL